jgi:formate hydrogenlyase subunit 6/NADH:ubiquinone oxidoreductase subunit I
MVGMKIGSMFTEIIKAFFTVPVTEKYPFEKPKTAARFRGKLYYDPAKCTGCNLCSKDCPANAFEIITLDRAAKRFVARYYLDRCAYCAQCVQSCKFKCINMSQSEWELAALSKESFLVYYGKNEDINAFLENIASITPNKV